MGPCSSKPSRIDTYEERDAPSVPRAQGLGTAAFLERYECSFTASEILGSGAYSTVFKCVDRNSREECAAKVVHLKQMADDESKALHVEVGILEEIKHPNVDLSGVTFSQSGRCRF